MGIGLLMWALPAEMVGERGGIQIIDGEIQRGAEFMRLYTGFQRAVASLVSSGFDVILDEVLLDGSEPAALGRSSRRSPGLLGGRAL